MTASIVMLMFEWILIEPKEVRSTNNARYLVDIDCYCFINLLDICTCGG